MALSSLAMALLPPLPCAPTPPIYTPAAATALHPNTPHIHTWCVTVRYLLALASLAMALLPLPSMQFRGRL